MSTENTEQPRMTVMDGQADDLRRQAMWDFLKVLDGDEEARARMEEIDRRLTRRPQLQVVSGGSEE